ncbi:putative diacylglycerol pyrophosphate phosphatase 1 [Porphyridium purpureum]|uniref:Putative diacylglycerol pyrophosphate phosphatase 1 n=1 Tax=Porphyridium purpureum TaxID=35688 RepID=A0A5J4Z065_PORPP|nr:putative diacylglycerol pyrophosphate phosphatase 1 [Porphyridium purpureum]|eukprot:POR3373..scf208_2
MSGATPRGMEERGSAGAHGLTYCEICWARPAGGGSRVARALRMVGELDALTLGVAMVVLVYVATTVRDPVVRPLMMMDVTRFAAKAEPEQVHVAEMYTLAFALVALIPTVEVLLRPRGRSVAHAFLLGLRQVSSYLTAGMLSVATTEASKATVGWMRPDFASRCFGPDALPIKEFSPRVITSDADCLFQQSLRDGRKSFPSGHSSFGFFFGTWVCVYLIHISTRFAMRRNMVANALQCIALVPLVYATWVACTRIVDNRHFPADVAMGSLIGIFCSALLHFRTLSIITETCPDAKTRADNIYFV